MCQVNIIETKYRKIISKIPHPNSKVIIDELKELEPRSMEGFLPVVWDHAEGFQVYDKEGNVWIDFTSAVVLANAGHSHPYIINAIKEQLDKKLLHNYCNPSEIRIRAIKSIKSILPKYLDKVFLLTTGSEAVECAIKLMRIYGKRISENKINILSYYDSFHGRTLASQAAGGFPDQQEWMGIKPGGFHHIPYPHCEQCPWGKKKYENCGKECFYKTLDIISEKGLKVQDIAGVISETYQGPYVNYMPLDYVSALRKWTKENGVLLVFDEIQAGYGRTGKWFGFEHYGVEPDLITMAKGMTSSLPMSGVAGRSEIMDIPRHGEMSSTHTGNPICCASLIANIEVIKNEELVQNAKIMGDILRNEILRLKKKFKGYIGSITGYGLALAVYILDPKTGNPDREYLASEIIDRCLQKGLMLLQTGNRGTLKLTPPLCITEDAVKDAVGVIEEVLEEILSDE